MALADMIRSAGQPLFERLYNDIQVHPPRPRKQRCPIASVGPATVDDQVTTGAANDAATSSALGERLHSRRTVLTGAAMGMGVAAAAVGAVASASPAGAVTAPKGNATGRSASGSDARVSPRSFNASADFTVQGTSSFSDVVSFARSGMLTMHAGKTSVTHTGVTLTSTSLVLASLQNSIPGVYVEAVVPSVSGKSFEIFLPKKVPSGVTAKVAWFIVN
jgi:hypothetical protein